jgi:hypothetical protein
LRCVMLVSMSVSISRVALVLADVAGYAFGFY